MDRRPMPFLGAWDEPAWLPTILMWLLVAGCLGFIVWVGFFYGR